MKILQVSSSFLPHRGGVETHLYELSSVLDKAGHEVEIVSSSSLGLKIWRYKKTSPPRFFSKPLTPPTSGIFSKIFYKYKIWSKIWKLRKHFIEADIVQVHDVWWWLLPIFPIVYPKLFITFHGWEGQYPIPLKSKIQRWVAGYLSKGVIHVGAWISEFYGGRKPDLVIYGGVKIFGKTLKTSTSQKVLKIAFLGRLSEDNQVPEYLQALENLSADKQLFEMTWIGDGPLRERCEKVGAVTGMINQPLTKLKDKDLIFANSYLSILEAQSLGKEVVVLVNHPLKKRYIETYPGRHLLTVVSSAKDLKKVILNPKKISHDSQKISKFAQTQSWEKVADGYQKVWSRIL